MRWPLVGLLAANGISATGNVLTMLAVPWFVLQSTGSPARTGVVALAATLPIVVSAVFAGTLVDRVGLRRASVVGDVRYERIPARLRARVLGTITAGAYAGMPLGGLLAGAQTQITGLTPTLLGFTTIYLFASTPPLAGRVWRQFDIKSRDDPDSLTTI